jgi:protein gp37
MANRLKGRYGYPKDDPFRVTFHPKKLSEPLHWIKSSRIFVCSMGDLFHENIPFKMIADVFGPMVIQKHTFLILTKRPKRMAQFLTKEWNKFMCTEWPWPHLWLGVSVENQKTADERIPILLQIPAAHRWVSIEPMLGVVHLNLWRRGISGQSGLDWIVCGCESGPKRRPCKVEWIRDLKNQCVAAGVPFFLKQGPGYFNGKSGIYKMPELDGKEWREIPK